MPNKNEISFWDEKKRIDNMIFYWVLSWRGYSNQEITEKLKLSCITTIQHYEKISNNTPEIKEAFLKETIWSGTNKKLTIPESTKYNKYENYACTINRRRLGNKTMWECLSSSGKIAYIQLRMFENWSLERITGELFKTINSENIDNFNTKLKWVKNLHEKNLTLDNITQFKAAEEAFAGNIESRIIKAKWQPLTIKERMLHVLWRLKEGMNSDQIAASLGIKYPIELQKYLDIAMHSSLEDIKALINQTKSIDTLIKNIEPLILAQESNTTELQKLEQAQRNQFQQAEFSNESSSSDTKIELWDSRKNMRNMIYIFCLKKRSINYKEMQKHIGISPSTIYKYLSVLKRCEEAKKDFFGHEEDKKPLDKIIAEYPDCTIYQNKLEKQDFWYWLTNEEREIYVRSRRSEGIENQEIAIKAGVSNDLIAKFANLCNMSIEEQNSFLATQKENSSYEFLSLPAKGWKGLSNEEKLFYILERDFALMPLDQIAKSLNILEEGVEKYLELARFGKLTDIKDFFNGEITATILNEKLKQTINASKETRDNTTNVPKRELTPQQEAILARLKSTSLQPYNASTIEESKRSKIELEKSSIKETLTREQEDLVPVAPKESEPQEINRPRRELTPQQEAILAGLKPCKALTSSQPSSGPFSIEESRKSSKRSKIEPEKPLTQEILSATLSSEDLVPVVTGQQAEADQALTSSQPSSGPFSLYEDGPPVIDFAWTKDGTLCFPRIEKPTQEDDYLMSQQSSFY